MAKKQIAVNPTSASAAVPARIAKPAAPRTRAAKHSKATVVPETLTELLSEIPTEFTASRIAVIEEPAHTSEANPQEAIAKLAYGFWEARGWQGGDPLEDWVRAEEEYRQRA